MSLNASRSSSLSTSRSAGSEVRAAPSTNSPSGSDRNTAVSLPSVDAEAIQPVGIRLTPDGKYAFVALGPANHLAVVNQQTYQVEKYLLVGQRVWQMAFTPDHKYLLTTNGISNDVSVIDVAALRPIRAVPVGAYPWGVAVSPH